MAANFKSGVFSYDTFIDGKQIRIDLDLNHPEIRRLAYKAMHNKTQRAVEAGGALKAQVLA